MGGFYGMENARTDIKLVVLGGGRMGEAMVAGWIDAGVLDSGRVTVVEPDDERRTALGALGVAVASNVVGAFPADVVVIAVKPQVIDVVLSQVAPVLGAGLLVSVAAGVTTARLESQLPAGAAVVRVMPNTPAMVGQGMAAISGGSEATSEHIELTTRLFDALGKTVVVDERYQNAATAISGSGPAYFALVIDALARAGVAAGLSREMAQSLAVQTMLGTAVLLEESGMHPEALIDGVASPGGTTIAAIAALEAAGVRAAFADAVAAAVARAEELGA